jgi:hypothetical protein
MWSSRPPPDSALLRCFASFNENYSTGHIRYQDAIFVDEDYGMEGEVRVSPFTDL